MEELIVNISNLITTKYNFYAHLNGDEKETLKEHTDRTVKYFKKLYEAKGIEKALTNFEKYYFQGLTLEGKNLFRKLLVNIFSFHDLGKINHLFQIKKMGNMIDGKGDFGRIDSKHSIVSAVLYIDYFFDEVKKLSDKEEKKKIRPFLYLNAYIISKHHAGLDDFLLFTDKFEEDGEVECVIRKFRDSYKDLYLKEIKEDLDKKANKAIKKYVLKELEKADKEKSVYLYTYVRLLFSLLVASDFYATTEFMNNLELNEFGEIEDIKEFYSIYKDTKIYNSIRSYEKDSYGKKSDFTNENNINVLRTEIFLDAERELDKNIENMIFYLEAPTGSGKSNVSMNLSFKLLEENPSLRKIYYVYPFNTLVEQNLKTIEKIYEENKNVMSKVAVINSISPIEVDDKAEEGCYKYYAKALLNRQFLNYPFILTTHVSLFNSMFVASKEDCFSFHQLSNSVIVLDEIQSYKNTIWTEIITFLKGISKILNIKVIIMSATLPNLSYLIDDFKDTVSLIKDRDKYFLNPLFKNRVEIDYSLLDKSLDEVYEHVKEQSKKQKRILIEFIKKETAYKFFEDLNEDEDIVSKVQLMTGDDNSIERERILKDIGSREDGQQDVILVATQVIEAGVDIDMDIGYKDISKLDSDEQFMGRINRSCKGEGRVYFFDYDECKNIYKNDCRNQSTLSLTNVDMQKILVNKDFHKFYEPVLSTLKNNFNNAGGSINIDEFFNKVALINSKEVEKRMKLIEDDMWSMSVYLAKTIEDEDGKILDGVSIWNEYTTLLKDNSLNYSEKEVKLSKVRALLNYFIYEIKKVHIPYNDRVGELYYIEDGENYFKNGKIDREKLITGVGDFI